MTRKLTITDERVISVIERLEYYACNLKWTNVRGAQDLLTAADGLRELQERRKAAMDGEPVAWTDEEELRDANESGSGYLFGIERDSNKFADPRRQIMLYRHAQLAPVVPDVMEPTIEAIKRILPTSNPDEYAACIGADMWNACRDTMLDRK